MTYHARISESDDVTLPALVAREIGIREGDKLVIERKGSDILIRLEDDLDTPIGRVRAAMRGYSVDQFLAERRADWGE